MNLVAPSISKDILLKGKMKQVCDEIVFFAVSFGILYFHKRLGQALNCSSFFVTNFHSSYHQGSLTSQFPKLEKAHKLQVPPTMAFSRLKWLLLQLLPSTISRTAAQADKIETLTKKPEAKPEQKRLGQVTDKAEHPKVHPMLKLKPCPTETSMDGLCPQSWNELEDAWTLTWVLSLQQVPQTLEFQWFPTLPHDWPYLYPFRGKAWIWEGCRR